MVWLNPTLWQALVERNLNQCTRESGKSSYQDRFLAHPLKVGMRRSVSVGSDRVKWYFHLTYNPVGHSKSKRVAVEDPVESYVLGTRQRLLASPLFKQQGSAQDLPSEAPPPPPPPTTQPDHTPKTSVTSILCRAVKVKLTYRASDIMLCCNFDYKLEKNAK